MALPFFVRGASNSKFLTYLNKHIFPLFDELPEERRVDLLKNLAECSPYTAPQDARLIFPAVVQLLKKYMPRRKTGEEMNFTYVECFLFTFHHLANRVIISWQSYPSIIFYEDCFYDLLYNIGYQIFVLRFTEDKERNYEVYSLYICRYIL